MIAFTALIKRFAEQGEKTGWTYIDIPASLAEQLKPNNKKSFRVKGKLDDYVFEGMALVPMGEGNFIMALNATVRKHIRKEKGATLQVQLEEDKREIKLSAELLECLQDEPLALAYFNKLPRSHQLYYTRWINSAKAESTKARRIAQAVTALAREQHYGKMIQSLKKDRTDLLG